MNKKYSSGFSLIEMMVAMAISSIVMGTIYSLWKTHEVEGNRLQKKIDLRTDFTLASKKMERAITLAGIGLDGALNLAKADAVGSDTLTIYSNPTEVHTTLQNKIDLGTDQIVVANPDLFNEGDYVAVSNGTNHEYRLIIHKSYSELKLNFPFLKNYQTADTHVMPVHQERYYSDQEENQLVKEAGGNVTVIAKHFHNFQVSFHDSHGASTEIQSEIRTVEFAFTGIYPANEGALNSIIFSSTAIPRNLL